MTSTTVGRVSTILARLTGMPDAGELAPATRILGGGLHLDSIVVLELLLALEKEFAVELDARELLECQALQSVGDLCAFVDRKRTG
jgi:acyl carrier protein